jgi:exopolysaccharide biosynthesis polyprenyl glycosylphosphotransferase
MLAASDIVGLTLSFGISMAFFAGTGDSNTVSEGIEFLIFLLTLPAWIVVANLYGLYFSDEERTDHSTADDLVGVFHLVTVGSWLFFIGATLSGLADPPLERLLFFWLIAIVLVTSMRAIARSLCRRSSAYLQNTVIVGAGDVGSLLARKFRQHPEYGLNVLGFVDANPKATVETLSGLPLLGSPERLPEIVRVLDVERVVIAFSNESHEDTIQLVRSLKDLDLKIDIVPRFFEVLGTNVGIHTAEGVPLMGLPSLRLARSALFMKRAFDLTASSLGLVVLAPVFLAVAVAIKLDSRGPVFFRQVRMGRGEEVFRIFKFRTMVVDADARKGELAALNKHNDGDPRMFKVVGDPRVTSVGRLLRRYSLDELPQLINVLVGDMSLVGPRPLILEEDRYVIDWRRRRLNLKPGITGLWQVLGRDGIPFEEMVSLDYLYVTTWSLMNDVKLLLRTVPVVFRRHVDV